MNKINYILLALLFSTSFVLAQETEITTIDFHVTNGENIKIDAADIYMEDLTAPMYSVGDGLYLPDKDKIEARASAQKLVKKNGVSTIDIYRKKPCFFFCAAPGMRTIRFFYPGTASSTIKLEIQMVDTHNIYPSSRQLVTTSNKGVNAFLKVDAFTSQSAYTDVVRYMEEKGLYKERYGSVEGFRFDLTNYYQQLVKWYAESSDKQLKNFILCQMAFLSVGDKFQVDKKYLLALIHEMPPSDYLWCTYFGKTAASGIYLGLGKFEKNKTILLPFFNALIEESAIEKQRINFLYQTLSALHEEQMQEALEYYNRLITIYPESSSAVQAVKRFGALSKIKVGDRLPKFSVMNLDQPSSKIDAKSIEGKIVLIDFWATWCTPCIRQFPQMDSLYKKYRDRGFEILSISLDSDIHLPVEFRKKGFSLPWLNGFADKSDSQLISDFQLYNIPQLVLVDPKGKILASGRHQLEGKKLASLLEQLFNQ